MPTKDHGHDPVNGNKFNGQKQKNAIVNQEMDEIILQENSKVSTEAEAHEMIKPDINENHLYQIDNMSLDDNK